ncbi:MAG: hypothetical protein ACE37I_00450 [Rubinisphaera brasiliensis]|uniref:hypothetical protein n=1 Tax=Rubinisphaera TaxID=1649490 RepID=UPI001F332434|nr:hypothetical protein [Rubinisphaera sp. JC750]
MPGKLITRCLVAAIVLSFAVTNLAQAQSVKSLAVHLPEDINTISVLRLKQMLHSEKGEREHWEATLEDHLRAGTSDLPPWLDTLVVGSLTHPAAPEEVWAAGLMGHPESIQLSQLAEHFQSNVETLAGRQVVKTNRNSYVIEMPDDVFGFYRPAHRQEVAEWIRDFDAAADVRFPGYLFDAADEPHDVVLAIYLQDMFDPALIRERLQSDERFARHQALVDQLTPLIAGLQGARLLIDVDSQSHCQIRIDFGQDVGPSAAVIKTLFLAIVEDSGAMIDEFPSARISTSGNSVVLRCDLSDSSLRRIISLIVPPRAPMAPDALVSAATDQPAGTADGNVQPGNAPENSQDDAAMTAFRANRRYLQAVNRMIDDLNRASQRAADYQKTVTWHETFARKIEALSTVNVDPELVDFGTRTADRFRALASSLRGQGISVNTQNQAITREVTSIDPGWVSANYWGGFGYAPPSVRMKSNLSEVREKQAAAVEKGRLDRSKIWDMIREDQAKMQKYMQPPRS